MPLPRGSTDGGRICSTYSIKLTPKIQELTRALEEEVEQRPVTRLLMTHPGVGPLTALAYELVIGTPDRFHCGNYDSRSYRLPTLAVKLKLFRSPAFACQLPSAQNWNTVP